MTRKCLAKAKNPRGVVYALVDNDNGTWNVLVLCQNYDGKVRGGVRTSWRVVTDKAGKQNMSEADARTIYTRRIK